MIIWLKAVVEDWNGNLRVSVNNLAISQKQQFFLRSKNDEIISRLSQQRVIYNGDMKFCYGIEMLLFKIYYRFNVVRLEKSDMFDW